MALGFEHTRSPRDGQATIKAVGLVTPAGLLVLCPMAWLALSGGLLSGSAYLIAAPIYALIGVGLIVAGWRACGTVAVTRATGVALPLAVGALGALYLLQTRGILYLTF